MRRDARGDVLVTGANGGVGSIAVAILSKLGYRVVAATGRRNTPSICTAWVPPRSSTARSFQNRASGR
jgi:NADPH:quinone reductase-like Zn-dependent oxidoreductase